MSFWEFAVVIGCGVAGFWLVSILIEAFGAKATMRPSDRAANDSAQTDTHSQAPK